MMQPIIALDQLLNAAFGGWADETLSARAWRCQGKQGPWPIVRRMIDALFFWQRAHCFVAYTAEQQRQHLPPEYRDRVR